MVSESLSGDAIASLNSGELLNRVQYKLQAGNQLEGGSANGLIPSMECQPGGKKLVGLTEFRLGFHLAKELDVRQTLLNKVPLAEENRDSQRPARIHTIVEYGDRYRGAMGASSLLSLSRLVLATMGVAASHNNIPMQSVFLSDGREPLLIEADNTPCDAVETMYLFDKFIEKTGEQKPQSASESSKTLAQSLELFSADDEVDVNSDVCLVVSDFRMGAQRSKTGQLVGFSWEAPLLSIADAMGDRLFVAQLRSPSHEQLPFVRSLDHGGQRLALDTAELRSLSDRYQQAGTEKTKRIRQILGHTRLLELHSTTEKPFLEVADFILGEPEIE